MAPEVRIIIEMQNLILRCRFIFRHIHLPDSDFFPEEFLCFYFKLENIFLIDSVVVSICGREYGISVHVYNVLIIRLEWSAYPSPQAVIFLSWEHLRYYLLAILKY